MSPVGAGRDGRPGKQQDGGPASAHPQESARWCRRIRQALPRPVFGSVSSSETNRNDKMVNHTN